MKSVLLNVFGQKKRRWTLAKKSGFRMTFTRKHLWRELAEWPGIFSTDGVSKSLISKNTKTFLMRHGKPDKVCEVKVSIRKNQKSQKTVVPESILKFRKRTFLDTEFYIESNGIGRLSTWRHPVEISARDGPGQDDFRSPTFLSDISAGWRHIELKLMPFDSA